MTITLTNEEAQQVLDVLNAWRTSHIAQPLADTSAPLIETLRARLSAPEPDPVAWLHLATDELKNKRGEDVVSFKKLDSKIAKTIYKAVLPLCTAPPQRERVKFPTMLRKMWSGTEVQAWLDENVNKEAE